MSSTIAQQRPKFHVDELTQKTYDRYVMNVVDTIIDDFGGLTAMASALGHKSPSIVQGWKKRGVIPPRKRKPVLDAATKLGVKIPLKRFHEMDGLTTA